MNEITPKDPASQPTEHVPPPTTGCDSPGNQATVGYTPLPEDTPKRSLPVVPGYDVLEELGRGGMGVVYKARQKSLKRTVALKMVLGGAHASPADLDRFRAEAEAVAQLQHSNIVQIYEVGEYEGYPYFSLEYVEGGSLAQLLQGQAQPAEWSATLVEALARGMRFAHEHGIIHRDLKPGNVLLSRRASCQLARADEQAGSLLYDPKIADFGLAKRLEGDSKHTRTGTILGTPSYMAPEQARGQTNDIGPQADVYALGAILYECLTGRPPFQAESPMDTMLQVIGHEPQRPSVILSTVPRDLETICLKALSKERSRRYATAGDLADDLSRFLHGQPIVARPISRLERLMRWCRRHPAVAGLLGVVAVLFAAVLLLVIRPEWKADHSWRNVQRAGKLRIATNPEYPPMEFRRHKDDPDIVGFDVDLGRDLCRRLGVEAEFVEVDWDWRKLADQLNEGEFDVLLSSITITDQRRELVEFAEYWQVPLVFLGSKGLKLTKMEDLAGKVVAVQQGTTAYELVLQQQRKHVAVKASLLFDTDGPFRALHEGTADVTLAHEPVARHHAKRNDKLDVYVPSDRPAEPIGIAFARGAKKLHKVVADKLAEQRDDGTLDVIANRWLPR